MFVELSEFSLYLYIIIIIYNYININIYTFKFRSGTHGLKKYWVGIEGGKVRRNVPCVGMSVRM